ncbi:TolC family protein, partial [bacterium]|nr:TolC family protein [bacterium]
MKKYSHLVLMFTVFVLCLFSPANSASEDKNNEGFLTLRQCIDLAIKNDPDVNNSLDQADIGRLQTKEAKKALILPRIDLETNYGPTLDYYGRVVVDEDIYESRASIEKPLYKGGGLITSYRMGKSETARAEHDYSQKVMEVTVDTIDLYHRLLSVQEGLKYYRELYGQAEKTVDILTKKLHIGAVIRINVLEAEKKLNEIQYQLIRAQGHLKTAREALNEKIGRDPGTSTRVVKEFPFQPLEGDEDALILEALEGRPDLSYEKENLEFNELRVKLNRSRELPSLSLVGSYAWKGEDFPGEDKEWAVMLNLSFSLYNSTLTSSVSRNELLENPYNFIPEDKEFDMKRIKLSLFDGSSNAVNLERARAACRLVKNKLIQLKRSIVKEVRDAVN